MEPFQVYMDDYRKQLEKGAIQQAYKGLMDYMLGLRTHFDSRYPGCFVSGSLYFGYMDMTYFSFIPPALKERNLKIAIVFLHEAFRFEAWLAGANKQVQAKTWKLIRESGWNKYHLMPSLQGEDAILQHVLVENPDFNDMQALTRHIEQGTLDFSRDIEKFLSNY